MLLIIKISGGAKKRAHGARVGGVAFSGDGAWVASVGTADKTLVIWKARERTP